MKDDKPLFIPDDLPPIEPGVITSAYGPEEAEQEIAGLIGKPPPAVEGDEDSDDVENEAG